MTTNLPFARGSVKWVRSKSRLPLSCFAGEGSGVRAIFAPHDPQSHLM